MSISFTCKDKNKFYIHTNLMNVRVNYNQPEQLWVQLSPKSSAGIFNFECWGPWSEIECDLWMIVATCFWETFKEYTQVVRIVEMFDLFDLFLVDKA